MAIVRSGKQSEFFSVSHTTVYNCTHRYKKLAQPGVSKDVALQDAQKALLKDPKFAHPFHWAAFILTGDSHPIRTTKESSD